jgi:hypothetical protein
MYLRTGEIQGMSPNKVCNSIIKDVRKTIKREHPKSNEIEHRMKHNPQKKDKKSRGIRFKKDHLPGFESSYYKDVNIVKRSHELPIPKSILRK